MFSLGPLAHLVERFHGMEEASGSIPLWSTTDDFSHKLHKKRYE